MEFRILGALEVVDGGRPLPIAGRRQRALLALLLLNANEVVASDRLIDELWSEPPRSGAAAVQTQISRLRRALGPAGGELLETRALPATCSMSRPTPWTPPGSSACWSRAGRRSGQVSRRRPPRR